MVYTNESKAEAFAEAMELQFQLNAHLKDVVAEDPPNRLPSTPSSFTSNPLHHSRRSANIKLLKTHTAPDPDLIPNNAIGLLPPLTSYPLNLLMLPPGNIPLSP